MILITVLSPNCESNTHENPVHQFENKNWSGFQFNNQYIQKTKYH